MKKSFVIFVLIVFLAAAANAAKFDLTVEKKGSYVYWFEYKNLSNKDAASLPQKFKGDKTSIDTSSMDAGYKDSKLFVMDKKTFNIASIAIPFKKDAKLLPIKLKSDNFNLIKLVKLKITTKDGAPLERAIVNIVDGDGNKFAGLVTPADFGVVEFNNVAAGEVNVKVNAENLERTINSNISLELDRPTPYFEKDIKVAGDVDTIEALAAANDNSKQAEAEKKSDGGGIFQMIAGFVFLALIIGVLYAILKAKGITAKKALNQMGVSLPDDAQNQSSQAQPEVDPNTCQFCGQKRDSSGRCACTIGAVPNQPSVSEGPMLVGIQGIYAGTIFKIPASGALVSREQPAEIALVNDQTVSRRHAYINASGGNYTIKDEGSSNGTTVNGVKITEQAIKAGDEIGIGGSRFRFEI